MMKPLRKRYFMYIFVASLIFWLVLSVLEHYSYANLGNTVEFTGVALLLSTMVSWLLSRQLEKKIFEPIRKATVVVKRLTSSETEYTIYPNEDEIDQLQNALSQVTLKIQANLREISTERNKFDAILRSMADGVVMLDQQGKVVLINPSAQKLFFLPQKSIKNKPLLEIIRNHQLAEMLDDTLKSGEILSKTIELITPLPTTLKVNTTPVQNEQGDILGVVAVLHDITEIARLQKMRSEFVANVSHELRTPLTSIKGFVETLLDGALHDPVLSNRFLEIISNETDRLEKLIADILSLSQIESNRSPLQKTTVQIASLIQHAVEILKPPLQKKELQLDIDASANLPAITVDRNRMEQVFINLIDNAIKYTPAHGSIMIKAGIQNNYISISFQDTGIGIPQESLARVFERFYRVDDARSRSMGGTGLGLSIVKNIIEAHYGTITVTSEPGKGSNFIITLPLN